MKGNENAMSNEGGRRDDHGKTRWELMAWDALEQVARVSTMGAKKYAPRNWEKGMLYSRVIGSMHRHYIRWWVYGEKVDEESGLPHLAHMAWNALAILTYELRGMGGKLVKNPDTGDMVPMDDRPFPEYTSTPESTDPSGLRWSESRRDNIIIDQNLDGYPGPGAPDRRE